jgi:murein DD-endopeptidase MepM/ murein hydrolase activator NlpD
MPFTLSSIRALVACLLSASLAFPVVVSHAQSDAPVSTESAAVAVSEESKVHIRQRLLTVPPQVLSFAQRRRRDRVWPLSVQASETYSMVLPVQGRVTRSYLPGSWHYGIDIAGDRNMPVIAARTGEVLHAGWDYTGYGRMVWIDHGDGLRTLYAHLNQIVVKKGQRVEGGQLIGLLGNTGNSLGPHLHMEISLEGKKLDPLAFFLHVIDSEPDALGHADHNHDQ